MWQFLAFFLLYFDKISAARDGSCPDPCFCTEHRVVYCARFGLRAIPIRIPVNATELNFNENELESPLIQRRNVSGFTNLENLYLSDCGIEQIEVGAFSDLVNLKKLDLSVNRIRAIEDYTFRGLSLQHLFLNGNRNLNLDRGSFVGLTTIGLRLQACGLSRLDVATFEPLNGSLGNLWLSENEITTISDEFRPMFSRLALIRLSSNPLSCNCRVKWLKDLFELSDGDQTFCRTPERLRGRAFSDLTSSDFSCSLPSFHNIDAVFDGDNGTLRCSATGDPTPTLFWVQPTQRSTVHKPRSRDSEERNYNEATLNVSARHTPRGELSGTYFCVAQNDAGKTTFTFNLTWPQHTPLIHVVPKLQAASHPPPSAPSPPPVVQDRVTSPNHIITSSLDTMTVRDADNSDVIVPQNSAGDDVSGGDAGSSETTSVKRSASLTSSKIFTLPQLLGAILGTFFATLLLCFILIPLYFRRKLKKSRDSPHHSLVPQSGASLHETVYLNGTNGRKTPPQLPPRPPNHQFIYYDAAIQSMNRR